MQENQGCDKSEYMEQFAIIFELFEHEVEVTENRKLITHGNHT